MISHNSISFTFGGKFICTCLVVSFSGALDKQTNKQIDLETCIPQFIRAAVMPGTARTSVIMLPCKKEEKVHEETMLISPPKEEKEEEQWRQNTGGEKEKNITAELDEDRKEMNSLTGGEIFEKAVEVQEGREEPREDVPLDLTQFSYLYPQTNNSATKKWVALFKKFNKKYVKIDIDVVQVFLRDKWAA